MPSAEIQPNEALFYWRVLHLTDLSQNPAKETHKIQLKAASANGKAPQRRNLWVAGWRQLMPTRLWTNCQKLTFGYL